MGRTRNGQEGFSLIELLIVVAIILVIAAIAIPNMLRARISANEASAANSVRKIATAEYAYSASYPTVGYAPMLSNLGGPVSGCTPTSTTACILDDVLSTGLKSGYAFVATGFAAAGTLNTTFMTSGTPTRYQSTGIRNFCVVTDGVLRSDAGTGAPPPTDVATCMAFPVAQ